jgi:hypothetical protein
MITGLELIGLTICTVLLVIWLTIDKEQ